MLNPSDVYVSGGSNNLLACWTDKVTKYDASSFYNWEQDNLPLHDLDERTELLWEKFGHPTSSLTGMSFIVSGDATSSCNPLYFTTLGSCIDALPEVINYPILVEVASFGNLGTLNISNKSFGPNGSLEIVNRNSSFAGAMDISGNGIAAQVYDNDYTDYHLASSISPIVSSLDASNPGLAYDMQSAQLFSNGQYISSGAHGQRWLDVRYQPSSNADSHPYVFSRKVRGLQNNRLTASLSSTQSPWYSLGSTALDVSNFSFVPFDKASHDKYYDVSTVNELSNEEFKWGNGVDDGSSDTAAAAFAYFNKLDSIVVNNCNGPIYIRNFNVDGENNIDRGIEIRSSKVNLERCSVSRCNEAGLYADNSEVNLLRGFVAYRNYAVNDSTRVGILFDEKRLTYQSLSGYGAGLKAVNSDINLKPTYQRDIDRATVTSSVNYSTYDGGVPAPSLQALYCLSRNDIGIDAVNSRITGGRVETGGSSTGSWNDASQLFSELNTEAGIRLEGSVLDYSGRLVLDGNYFGLTSESSKINADTVTARFNQSTGLKFVNSEFTYNKDLYPSQLFASPTSVTNYLESQVACISNAQDIVCDNSTIKPLVTDSMQDLYSMVYTSGCFGSEDKEGGGTSLLPSIHADNNSTLDLVHAHVDRTGLADDMSGDTNATYGGMVRSTNNSTVTCRGSSNYANIFLGPSTRSRALKLNALYAGSESTIYLQGPTVVAQAGVDALAENNSLIDFGPHRNSAGELLVSAFNLSSGNNHTMVELHSTRACLVANQNSTLKMQDLGSYVRTYGASPSVSARSDTYTYTYDDLKDTCVSNGWMQLYPNGISNNTSDEFGVPNSVGLAATTNVNRYRFQADGSPVVNYRYLKAYSTLDETASGVTTGGMSVRAVGDSLVEATNVHFPCGWANTSGYAYDYFGVAPLNGPFCSRLHIWNISDQSLLKASYLSVSGQHPVDAAYHGPSGTWGASAAPSTTPDTSGLSLLDYYGIDGDGRNPVLGASSVENLGPFRLYFSVEPAARFLEAEYSTTPVSGLVYQLFSQGYNWSGTVSAMDNPNYGASANHVSLLIKDPARAHDSADADKYFASGFYYVSSMLSNPKSLLVSVDDSGANTFCNSKHNSVGKSGLGKVVEVYYPTKNFGGDSDDDSQYGKGLLSVNNFDLKKDN